MRARVALILIILGLLMAVTAAPVSAGGGSLAIANADGGIGKGFDSLFGGPWTEGVSGCPSGAYFDTDRYRSALEFPLTDLPPEATVLSATLTLHASTQFTFIQHAMYGYAGDGSITEPDIQVTGTPILFTPITNGALADYDVTSLVTAATISAGSAGFSIRPDPESVTTFDSFVCGDGFIEELGPVLTITYDLPNPPTPGTSSLPNAATAPPPTGSPLAAIGFGLLLIGTLGSVAVANLGVVRRR